MGKHFIYIRTIGWVKFTAKHADIPPNAMDWNKFAFVSLPAAIFSFLKLLCFYFSFLLFLIFLWIASCYYEVCADQMFKNRCGCVSCFEKYFSPFLLLTLRAKMKCCPLSHCKNTAWWTVIVLDPYSSTSTTSTSSTRTTKGCASFCSCMNCTVPGARNTNLLGIVLSFKFLI